MKSNELYIHLGIASVYLFGAIFSVNALSVLAALVGVVYCSYRVYEEYTKK